MPRSSLLLQTLRDFRRPALRWGLGWLSFGLLLFIFLPLLRLPPSGWFGDWQVQLAGSRGWLSWLAGLGLGILLPLGLGIQAACAGGQLLTVEREGGLLALLLASPLPRTRLYDEKIAAFLTWFLLQGLAMGLLFEIYAAAFGLELAFGRVLLSVLFALALGLIAGWVALLASILGADQRQAVGWGLLGLFLIGLHSLAASIWPLNWLKVSSLLQAAASGGILQSQPFGWPALLLLGVGLLLLWLARAAFSRRDLEI